MESPDCPCSKSIQLIKEYQICYEISCRYRKYSVLKIKMLDWPLWELTFGHGLRSYFFYQHFSKNKKKMMIPSLFDHVFSCANKGHKCPNSKAQDINGPFILLLSLLLMIVSVFLFYNSSILPLQLVCTHFFFFWYVLIEVYGLG